MDEAGERTADVTDMIKLAEELIFIMDNGKEDKNSIDNIMKEWEKILEIRGTHLENSKVNKQEITELGCLAEDNYRKTETVLDKVNLEGQNLEQFVSQRKEELSTLVSECDRLKQNLESYQQEAERLEVEKQEKEVQKKISIPLTKHEIRLYKMITNLHLQKDPTSNEIKGCVFGKSDAVPFTINQGQMSKYDLVNSVWDMIEEDW